ncbi:MAG: MurR/RpiR family transcriptional regulator [Thermoanaerobaculales bacterium]|jgi:DNA-binding MurR/RpiR family transcriptional regulator|nr:MurR/RpiR family transcriptional regulator [Thermoanaerobaculales bacterium]
MPDEPTGADVRDRILEHVGALPPQQRAIADYLLENLETVPFLSVPELARRCHASEATIVRFGQRIGFSGFAELKVALVELLQSRLGVDGVDDAQELSDDLIESVAAHENRNIRRTADSIDREVFSSIAERIFAADRVTTFGLGISAHIARLAAYTFVQIGIAAHALSTGYSSPREQLVTMRPNDLLLVVSLPPYSRQSLELLSAASDAGIATVALSDRLTSPTARAADLSLAVRSDNLTFTNSVAAMTMVVNALATAIASRHRDEAIDAFTTIGRILADDADVITS